MKQQLLRAAVVRALIPKRSKQSHKGKNGHVLVVAGSSGMTGAAYLCALGALKAGAGLVTVAGEPAVRKIITSRLPEAMTVSLAGIGEYVRRRTITTLAVGPGLGVSARAARLIRRLLALRLHTVLDADGLNNIALKDLNGRPVIITPHPGEFARLSGLTKGPLSSQRLPITQRLAKRLGIVCVLKGFHTVVSDGTRVSINSTGNPAMATGGMGDVLTGIISGLLAQGLSLYDAACAGVFVHGLAGDLATTSDRGLLATELALRIPQAFGKLGLR